MLLPWQGIARGVISLDGLPPVTRSVIINYLVLVSRVAPLAVRLAFLPCSREVTFFALAAASDTWGLVRLINRS